MICNLDFRGYLVTSIEEGNADEQTIEEVLAFYNMATSTVLNFLATGWSVKSILVHSMKRLRACHFPISSIHPNQWPLKETATTGTEVNGK